MAASHTREMPHSGCRGLCSRATQFHLACFLVPPPRPELEQSRLKTTTRYLVWQLHRPALLFSSYWLITPLHQMLTVLEASWWQRLCVLPTCFWIKNSDSPRAFEGGYTFAVGSWVPPPFSESKIKPLASLVIGSALFQNPQPPAWWR